MSVLLVTADLLISSQVAGAVGQGDVDLHTCARPHDALEFASRQELRLVLVDLSTPGLDVATLVSDLHALNPAPRKILAFGPHVHADRLAAARAAGCDEVLSRGALHAGLSNLFDDLDNR